MKRIIIYAMAVAGLLSRPALHAQDRHEFSIYSGGGLSSLKYEAPIGEHKNGFGGQAGLGYRFFFSPNWGLGTGAEIALYKTVFNPDNIGTHYMATDTDGDAFEFRSTISGYKEKQQALFLQIPLTLQYQTGGTHKFYLAAGGKIGLPLSGKYKSSSADIRNSGFYAEENYEYTTQEFMGFGAFPGKDYDGSLKFKAAFYASAEAGVKWRLKDGLSLYTGAYMDYGLNNIYKESSPARQFVTCNSESPRDFTVNSVLNSQYAPDGVPQAFTGKITPVAFGIKISLAFGTGSSVKKRTAYIPPVTDNTAVDTRSRTVEKVQPDVPAEKPKVESVAASEKKRQEEAVPGEAETVGTTIKEPVSQVVFRFIIRDDRFFLQGNEAEIERLYNFTDKYHTEITGGQLPVHVDGYCASFDNRKDNLRTAYLRASRVKSQLIIKKGLKEEHFITRTHAESYMDEKDVVVVLFSFGTDAGA